MAKAVSWERAEGLSAAGSWAEAGAAWAELAEKSWKKGDHRKAREAAARGADAWRRDDRPAATAKLLRSYAQPGKRSVTDEVQLAAVLMEAGEVRAAADIAEASLLRAQEPADRAIALDTLAGLRLAAGDVEGARRTVTEAGRLGIPGAEMARRFRTAQLDRLDGALGAAATGWTQLVTQLEPYTEARGPAAACYGELAELQLLRLALGAEPRLCLLRALDALARASRGWQEAGRRSAYFRTQAWIARVRALQGEVVHPGAIDTALLYAAERQLPLLEADLRLCRAVVTASAADAEAALRRLDETPLARGRCRVIFMELGGNLSVDATFKELEQDAPWTARAMIAVGRRLPDPALLADGQARAAALLG